MFDNLEKKFVDKIKLIQLLPLQPTIVLFKCKQIKIMCV